MTNIPQTGTDIVAADPFGRFYLATFSEKFCRNSPNLSIYRFDVDTGVKRLADGFRGSSGLGLDTNAKKLYHLEYCTLILTSFDWGPATVYTF